MNLRQWEKVEYDNDGKAIIPVKIKLFYKYFIDTEDILWTDRDDEFQFSTLKLNPRYVEDIADCRDIKTLMQMHRNLQAMNIL